MVVSVEDVSVLVVSVAVVSVAVESEAVVSVAVESEAVVSVPVESDAESLEDAPVVSEATGVESEVDNENGATSPSAPDAISPITNRAASPTPPFRKRCLNRPPNLVPSLLCLTPHNPCLRSFLRPPEPHSTADAQKPGCAPGGRVELDMVSCPQNSPCLSPCTAPRDAEPQRAREAHHRR